MNNLSKNKTVNLPIALFLIVVVVFIRFYVFPVLTNFPEEAPDGLFYYTTDELKSIVFNYSEQDIKNYKKLSLSLDLIFPVLYGLMFLEIKLLLFRWFRIKNKFHWMNMFAFLPTIFDFIENFSMVSLLSKLPDFSQNLAEFISYITFLKYSSMFVFAVVLMIIINYTMSYRIRHKQKIFP